MGATKKNKKRTPKKREPHALYGGTQPAQASFTDTAKDGLILLVTAIAAGGAGAAIGKHSLLAGIPLTFLGIHKRSKLLVALGLGLTLSNGFQKKGQSASTSITTSVEGFDLKQIGQDAKERVGTFFQNFSQKLYLPQPATDQSTSGIGDEEVTYFVNPYNNGAGDLDMSELDKIQQQVAQMNKQGGNLNDIDREM